MSRIYLVTDGKSGKVLRHVRANTLSGAIRAHAEELFEARTATAEDIVAAASAGNLDVLDATVKAEPESEDAADPGPVPLRAV
jgi:hypothetical protein